jgi:pyruvate dehydrogenase E1 component alpha subunit
MDDARSGLGPTLIEALTYRIGAHTTSDDPSKYRDPEEVAYWEARDPIIRFEKFLRKQGIGQDFFDEVAVAGDVIAAEVREATFALTEPPLENMFDHVYSEPHPLIEEQKAWLQKYEAELDGHTSSTGDGGVNYGGTR